MREVQSASGTLGLEVKTLDIRQAEDIARAFDELKGHADALYVCIDTILFANRIRIITVALAARLPTMFTTREAVKAGGLMTYGPSFPELFRRAGDYVDKFCTGRSPRICRSSSQLSSISSLI